MTVELKIKEVREKVGISLRRLEELTGIDRERLSQIEAKKVSIDDILFVEMVLIAEGLACRINDLYEIGTIVIVSE